MTILMDNAQKRANIPSDKVKVNQQHGRMRVMYDEFDFLATSSLPTTENFLVGAPLPGGAKVYEVIASVDGIIVNGDLLSIGHLANDDQVADLDAFITVLDVSAGAAIGKMSNTAGQAGFAKELTKETQLVINNGNAGSLSAVATRKVKVWVIYSNNS
jgi:hypothetical protein